MRLVAVTVLPAETTAVFVVSASVIATPAPMAAVPPLVDMPPADPSAADAASVCALEAKVTPVPEIVSPVAVATKPASDDVVARSRPIAAATET